jgi:DNA-binding NarL/FixJ family response regulator
MQQCLRAFEWMSWGRGKFSFFLGWFAFLDGDLDQAAALLATSLTAFERAGDRRSLPDTLDAQACLAAARGESAQALRLFDRSAAIRGRTGARRHTYLWSHCQGAEVRARAAIAPPPTGITAREMEVAGLLADGLTNRQIGRRLAISERTAERHVEQLRAKLGVHTRAQVAVWVSAVPTTSN